MRIRHDGRFLSVHTPAKLNLFLEVLGKRSDGYHEVETLMVTIGLYDTLTFTEDSSGRVSLRLSDAGTRKARDSSAAVEAVPIGADNLVMKAASLLRSDAGVGLGVRIELQKRIPVAAGLAGGSSDAAATLVALNRLWNLKLTLGELQQFASRLGSDVSFFLSRSSAAICRGRGEIIEPLPVPLGLHFVVVRPRSGLSTADVYRHCQPARAPSSVGGLVDALCRGRLRRVAGLLHNALQPPAERLSSDVKDLKTRFSQLPVIGHMMSGSGTAYFGLCGNRRQARQIAARSHVCGESVHVVQCRP